MTDLPTLAPQQPENSKVYVQVLCPT